MTVHVTELMDTPAGRDEVSTPDEQIERCDDCGALYRAGGWHACTDDDARGDGGAAVADGGHELPAGWVRVFENGMHKLTKRGADLEVQITSHCVGVDGDRVAQQGWQVDDPHAIGAELAAAFEDHLYSAAARETSEKRVLRRLWGRAVMQGETRLNTLAEQRSDAFDATILHNRIYEAVKDQHDHGPDLRRYVTVAEDVYGLSADEDIDGRRLDVFGAAEEINDHIDDVADEVVAATLVDLLEDIDDWDDVHDRDDIDAAKHEARNWLQANNEAAERAVVWDGVYA